MSENTLSY